MTVTTRENTLLQELAGLYALTGPLRRSLDLTEVLDEALEKILAATRAEAGSIRLIEEGTGRFLLSAHRGLPDSYMAETPPQLKQTGVTGQVLGTREPLLAEDLRRDTRFAGGLLRKEGFRSAAYLPLLSAEGSLGILTLASRTRGAFSPKNRQFLMAIAQQISTALENAQLFAEIARQAREQAALNSLTTLISESVDLATVLAAAAKGVHEVTGFSAVGIYLLSSDGTIRLAHHHGMTPALAAAATTYRIGEGKAGRVVETRSPLLLEDISQDPLYHSLSQEKLALRHGYRSLFLLPITAHDRCLGALSLMDQKVHRARLPELNFLTAIAHQIGLAIANAHLFADTEKKALRVQALTQLTQIMNSRMTSPEVNDCVVQAAAEILGATLTQLWVVEPPSHFTLAADFLIEPLSDYPFSRGDRFDMEHGIVGSIFRSGQPEFLSNIQENARFRRAEFLRRADFHSFAGIPLLVEGHCLGVLSAFLHSHREFSPEDRALFTIFANQAAGVVENARLFREATDTAQELAVRNEIAGSLSQSLQLSTLLETTLTQVLRHLGVAAGRVYLLEGEPPTLVLKAQRGLTDDQASRISRYRPGEGVAGWVAQTGSVLAIDDITTDPRYEKLTATHTAATAGYRALVAAPIRRQEKILGVLLLLHPTPRHFSDRDTHLLWVLGQQVGMVIDNALLYGQVERAGQTSREASLRKSHFLANMSHELRTPLNSVIGFSEVLLDRLFGDLNDKQMRYVTNIHRSGQHLLRLINDILDLSKIEAGKVDLKREPLVLSDVITEVESSVRPLADKNGITLAETLAPALPPLLADRTRLTQILSNLLGNAIKFTPAGGSVTVSARRVPGEGGAAGTGSECVEIAVTDTGVGIAEEALPFLFQEFERVNSPEVREIEGTGLGLALTKKLVEMHGGTIQVTSTTGKGSTFTVRLPILETPPLPGKEQTEAHPPRILITDDDQRLRRALAITLKAQGFDVTEAASGEECLTALRRERPHALVLDLGLPGMSGQQVLSHLREDPDLQSLPVIVVTGQTLTPQERRELTGKIHALFVKDTNLAELLTRQLRELVPGLL